MGLSVDLAGTGAAFFAEAAAADMVALLPAACAKGQQWTLSSGVGHQALNALEKLSDSLGIELPQKH